MRCINSLGRNYYSKARYYSPVNVVSVYSQYSSLSLAEKSGSDTAQSGALPCSAFEVTH